MPKERKLNLAPDAVRHVYAVPDEPEDIVVRDAILGGDGLDWLDVPEQLAGEGLAEWERLALQFADQPTRFRESDRFLMIQYCQTADFLSQATAELQRDGLMVRGRSNSDADRSVKNSVWTMWRGFSAELRQYANQLQLTPASRRRAGRVEPDPATNRPEDNPFSPFNPANQQRA